MMRMKMNYYNEYVGKNYLILHDYRRINYVGSVEIEAKFLNTQHRDYNNHEMNYLYYEFFQLQNV